MKVFDVIFADWFNNRTGRISVQKSKSGRLFLSFSFVIMHGLRKGCGAFVFLSKTHARCQCECGVPQWLHFTVWRRLNPF